MCEFMIRLLPITETGFLLASLVASAKALKEEKIHIRQIHLFCALFGSEQNIHMDRSIASEILAT
jgi:hypothetical protein